MYTYICYSQFCILVNSDNTIYSITSQIYIIIRESIFGNHENFFLNSKLDFD